jgi:hypothetical protein
MKTKKVVNKFTSFKKTTKKKQNAGGLRSAFTKIFGKTPKDMFKYKTTPPLKPEPESDQAFIGNITNIKEKIESENRALREKTLKRKEYRAKRALTKKQDEVKKNYIKTHFMNDNHKEAELKLNKLKKKYEPFFKKLPELRFNIKELQNKLTIDNITTFNIIKGELEQLINSIKKYYNETDIPTPPSNRNSNENLYFTSSIIDSKQDLNQDFMYDLNDAFKLIKIDMNTSNINRNNPITRTLEYDVTVFIKNIQFIIFSYTFMKYAEQVRDKLDLIKNPVIKSNPIKNQNPGSNLVWRD